ncbi:DUF1972 domain-containing protein [Parapedobacter indicus]|uniref:Glycosyltransferase involved in cell wall bisynthesis n=1 Tax=Parapedobacter indicus TaxID=1477437 RepID=A0A1I3TDZ9_9SPHI|nr:DUF1972 domain-containing protein [Parapedobacter indicus]PPK99535.1 glycosyltransferase involved in cell wall biosynthesis [Parapedobacter indicus]SFJ68840.1 Glycosyltransferase involved in cell wall bisynthesis [Parapedobacter indicus]
MKRKTIAIIGTNGLPGRYGGWDQLMNNLTTKLRGKYHFIVYTSSFNAVEGIKEVNGAKLVIIKLKANGWQSVPYDGISLLHAAFKYDILLVLGTSGCVILPLIRLFSKKIILNPDGAEWKRGKWNPVVQRFLKLSERIGIKFAHSVIADNKVFQDHILKEYNKASFLIEYGGDNAVSVELTENTCRKYEIQKGNYAFKVCRIEPENNIDLILEAFSCCKSKILLIGNWNFSDYGRKLRKKYSGFENMLLLDPIYEQVTLDELRSNCGIYVHGHSVGGTNPSLVEAMTLGLCCLVYDVDYNRETTENKAIYFRNSEELKKLVNDFENGVLDNQYVGQKMTEIAKKRYKWSVIVDKYNQLFK